MSVPDLAESFCCGGGEHTVLIKASGPAEFVSGRRWRMYADNGAASSKQQQHSTGGSRALLWGVLLGAVALCFICTAAVPIQQGGKTFLNLTLLRPEPQVPYVSAHAVLTTFRGCWVRVKVLGNGTCNVVLPAEQSRSWQEPPPGGQLQQAQCAMPSQNVHVCPLAKTTCALRLTVTHVTWDQPCSSCVIHTHNPFHAAAAAAAAATAAALCACRSTRRTRRCVLPRLQLLSYRLLSRGGRTRTELQTRWLCRKHQKWT